VKTCSLSSWTLDTGVEPTIRVGTILPEDGTAATTVVVPDAAYNVSIESASAGHVRGATLAVAVENGGVVLRQGADVLARGKIAVLSPNEPVPCEAGAGVKVRDVVSGRGFHWQKRFEAALTGAIEFREHGGKLVVVNELPLEDYLTGVITGEMSGECPLEFLKSQCVVARAWVLAHTEKKHAELPVDRCNDDCCQRYHGTTNLTPRAVEAVRGTRGGVLVDSQRRIIDANYSKSCGGVIETPEHVWGVSKPGQRAAVDAPKNSAAQRFLPVTEANLDDFLTGRWLADTDVFCSPTVIPDADLRRYLGKVDEGGGHFRWRVEFSREEFEIILREKYFGRYAPADAPPMSALKDLRAVRRGVSGRATALEIDYRDFLGQIHTVRVETEYRIRDCLYTKFLFSSAFRVEIERGGGAYPERIALVGAGWGHGAGLCQIGALGMAMRGYTCEQILSHYFEGVQLHASY
jgi:SpoIID/LytB domain protein